MIVVNFYKSILLIFLIILYYGLKIASKNRYFNLLIHSRKRILKNFFQLELFYIIHLGFLIKFSSGFFIPKIYIGHPMVGFFFLFWIWSNEKFCK